MSSATVVNSQTLSVAKGSNLTRAMSNGAAATPRTLDLSRGEPELPRQCACRQSPNGFEEPDQRLRYDRCADVDGGEALVEAGGIANNYSVDNGYVDIFSGGTETGVTSLIDGAKQGVAITLARNSQSAIERLDVPSAVV